MKLEERFLNGADDIRRLAMQTLFERLDSVMRQVVQTSEPILLDIMEFADEQFVVTRMPLNDERGQVIGAIGFVLYDRLQYLKPLVTKFAHMQSELSSAQRRIAEGSRALHVCEPRVGRERSCWRTPFMLHRREPTSRTLFLDEVGDMPMAMQAKLLRVLQEQKGRFRSDLYYRLGCRAHRHWRSAGGRARQQIACCADTWRFEDDALREARPARRELP